MLIPETDVFVKRYYTYKHLHKYNEFKFVNRHRNYHEAIPELRQLVFRLICDWLLLLQNIEVGKTKVKSKALCATTGFFFFFFFF